MLRRSISVLKNSQYHFVSNISNRLKIHTSVFPVLYSKFYKDLPNPNLPTPVSKLGHGTDILLDQLKGSRTLDRLLELVNMHLNVMNSTHIITSFSNMHEFIKDDEVLAKKLLEHSIFKALSTRLMKVIRLLEPDEVITCYKLFCLLQVRNNTYIMQSILKMLGAHLNNMSLGQLTFLSFLLHKQRHNPLVDGLRLALPLVLQVQIDQQLDSDNLRDVVNCLQLSCRARLKPAVIQKIVNVIREKVSDLGRDEALTVSYSLMNIEAPIDGYKELLDNSLEVLSRHVPDLSEKRILTLLKTCQNQRVYHFMLFFNIANLIVSQKWNLDSTYTAVNYLNNLEFSPSNLIDYFTYVLCLESKEYLEKNYLSPLSCIEYLTATQYRPVNCDEAARVLYSREEKLENLRTRYPHLFIKFLSCLAMLGHFPTNLLSQVLDENYLFSAWQISKRLGRATEFEQFVLCLYWGLQVYDEVNNFVIPTSLLNGIIHSVYQKHAEAEYPLSKFIENGLGGSQFLQSGVFTEDGQVIDHLVAMRSGNYPVSLQNIKYNERKGIASQNVTFFEDMILPDDAKIIAVLVAKDEHFFRDPEILKGWVDMKVRSLAKKNFSTVVINYTLWKNLPDREKIPYLMREIKQVVPEDFTFKSNFS